MAKKSSVTDSPRKLPARATRSQSREVEPVSPRKSARNTRQASVESTASASGRPSRARNNVDSIQDLPPLQENAEEDDAPLSVQDDDVEDDGMPSNMSVGRASAYSGTTAKTTFSNEAIAQLDADIMVEMLPNLDAASNAVLRVLMPQDVPSRPFAWKDIATPNTKTNRVFKTHVSNYVNQKDHFVVDGEDYIQPSIVLRAMLSVATLDEVPQANWRPDAIIYKANLSRLLHALLIEARDPVNPDSEAYDVLESAEAWFPKAVAGAAWSSAAFTLTLAISTQLVIKRLASFAQDPNYDPAGVATSIFFEVDEETGDLTYRHFDALHMDQLSEEELQARWGEIERLVDTLKKPFDELDATTAVNTLRAQFSWDTFISSVEGYYDHRKRVLDDHIAQAGGVEHIVEGLERVIQDRNENMRAQTLRTSLGTAATPKKFAVADIAALKAMEERVSPQPAAPVAQMSVSAYPELPQQTSEHGGYAVLEDDGEVHLQPSQRLNTHSPESKKTGKAKMKSFLDPQPGRHRVPWESSQVSEFDAPGPNPHRRVASPNIDPTLRATASPAKRPYDRVDQRHDDWQPTQDEGFMTDTRSTAAADARRNNMHRIRQKSAVTHNPRSSQQEEQPVRASGSRTQDEPSPSKRARKNPGSIIPPRVPTPDFNATDIAPTQVYHQAKVSSKQNRLFEPQKARPRVRRPWSEREEDAFMDLIINNEDGDSISYAKLKTTDEARQEDQQLEHRTAEDLRMKARNMKVTLLLAKVPLPPNWNGVMLGKKEQEKLRSRGIEYEQEKVRGTGFDFE